MSKILVIASLLHVFHSHVFTSFGRGSIGAALLVPTNSNSIHLLFDISSGDGGKSEKLRD